MRYSLDAHAVDPAKDPTDPAWRVRDLFDVRTGCDAFTQRLLELPAGASRRRPAAEGDEVLYVLAGSGTLSTGGNDAQVGPGTAVFVASGSDWSVSSTAPLSLLSVVVHEPMPASAPSAVVDLAHGTAAAATAGRSFLLGASPKCGCMSATQFIGLIPPGRAPDHFHTYDEVIYVLDGEGVLEIGSEQAALRAGTCVHLPARLVHSLANTGESTLRVLGVFRPAGSPAEAYYPDGTPALMPEAV